MQAYATQGKRLYTLQEYSVKQSSSALSRHTLSKPRPKLEWYLWNGGVYSYIHVLPDELLFKSN